MNTYRVEVVIPVGPGDPTRDVPKLDLLELGLRAIKQQTIPVKLTCAVDEDLQSNRLEIIKQYADHIRVFPAYSYHRAGGIWDKIYTCWEESDCDYVAWSGYDDYSAPDRFRQQMERLDQTGSNSCISLNAQLFGHNPPSTFAPITEQHFLSRLGQHYLYMGSFLLRRTAILNSGIVVYRKKWSYYFEGLLYTFILKTGLPVRTDSFNGFFAYRDHSGTITHTYQNEWFANVLSKIDYTPEQCKQDWDSINFPSLCQQVRDLYL